MFPRSLVDLTDRLRCAKTQEFFFRGVDTAARKWVKQYVGLPRSKIEFSRRGRDPNKKHENDVDYFENLSRSKFACCPVGGCWDQKNQSWTYRFFEAILCRAVPVLESFDKERFHCPFFCYAKDEIGKYCPEEAEKNRQLLLESLHFLKSSDFCAPRVLVNVSPATRQAGWTSALQLKAKANECPETLVLASLSPTAKSNINLGDLFGPFGKVHGSATGQSEDKKHPRRGPKGPLRRSSRKYSPVAEPDSFKESSRQRNRSGLRPY